jgi:hypothetical protein
MTIAARAISMNAAATRERPATSWRKSAIATGVLFLISDVLAIPAVLLYQPALSNPNFIIGSGPDTQVLLGVLCDIIVALAVAGTSVALFPVVKRWGEGVALGYVGLRTLEAGIVAVGVIPMLAVVSLRQHLTGAAGTDPATLAPIGSALAALYNGTFLVGPGLVCPVNTVLMASLMYRSRLVPRFIPVLGLVGAPLVFATNSAKMFGLFEGTPPWVGIAVLPLFAWEVTLSIYLIVKGFRASALAAASPNTAPNELRAA